MAILYKQYCDTEEQFISVQNKPVHKIAFTKGQYIITLRFVILTIVFGSWWTNLFARIFCNLFTIIKGKYCHWSCRHSGPSLPKKGNKFMNHFSSKFKLPCKEVKKTKG